ncbi:hypothetical protein ANCCAN_29558 [Ancylostoma caninum]|uniref:GTP-binding protein LepA C-terminal domain-containing protein n=1 Tax=Ancylostoma caninum TaxID=29170 RepID=A0A368F167_ANCCA|nr:hypothetical protein ANCCAN_29558 [Ancylostoma caninum]
MIVPAEMMGVVNGLCSECRGERGEISSIDEDRVMIIWRLPLAEGMERLNKKLSHQKKGKERMKQIGNVQIPKEALMS